MNIETKMTPRLRMVVELLPSCRSVADIGTDHGYLPIYLVNKGICEKAIAADVNEGPLSAAQKNISLTRVKDRIHTCLSDGLEKIGDVDCVTIAGMGGELISEILSHRKECHKRFVLQPQRSYDDLRCYLAENGFEIKKEAVCRENDKMYCAFYAEFTGEKKEIGEKEALLGKASLFEDIKLYREYIQYRKKEVTKALENMEKVNAKGERYEELLKIMAIYEERENEIRENY